MPSTSPARCTAAHLLAHELAHVVQQRRGGAVPALDADAGHERGADAAAASYAAAPGRSTSPARPHRRRPRRGEEEAALSRASTRRRSSATASGTGKHTIPDWPVDPYLRDLWNALAVPPSIEGKAPASDAALMARPEFIVFADTVAEFPARQPAGGRFVVRSAVNPTTAAKLRERNAKRAEASAKEAETKAAAAAARGGEGEGIPHSSASGTAKLSVGISGSVSPDRRRCVEGEGRRRRSARRPEQGEEGRRRVHRQPDPDEIEGFVLKQLKSSLGLPDTAAARLLGAFATGLARQLYKELVSEGKGRAFVKKLLGMKIGDVGQLYKGYVIGLLEGLVSPVSDLFAWGPRRIDQETSSTTASSACSAARAIIRRSGTTSSPPRTRSASRWATSGKAFARIRPRSRWRCCKRPRRSTRR
jgi:hypothetical protein